MFLCHSIDTLTAINYRTLLLDITTLINSEFSNSVHFFFSHPYFLLVT